jgi:hypothetical protein
VLIDEVDFERLIVVEGCDWFGGVDGEVDGEILGGNRW